jgi:hypothetical protein
MSPAVLFTTSTGPYAALGAECFDLARDARTFDLSRPVVAHPPCRAWGKLSHFAKPRDDERDLAIWAMWVVRHCGGVLEHPITSRLWAFFGIKPGVRDAFGGLLVPVDQSGFGHRAQKRTGLYLVRCARPLVPPIFCQSSAVVERMCRQERERTPVALARELLDLAGSAS